LSTKRKDIHDVFFLATAREDVLVEAPTSKGEHHKIKLAAVLDYKYKNGVERSDQMLSYYSFERKAIKWWKKISFIYSTW
jgi:predicted RNA-binding protein with PIN domain